MAVERLRVAEVEGALWDGEAEDAVAADDRGDLGAVLHAVRGASEQLEAGSRREDAVDDAGNESVNERHRDGRVARLGEKLDDRLGRRAIGAKVSRRSGGARLVDEGFEDAKVEGARALLSGDVYAEALRQANELGLGHVLDHSVTLTAESICCCSESSLESASISHLTRRERAGGSEKVGEGVGECCDRSRESREARDRRDLITSW